MMNFLFALFSIGVVFTTTTVTAGEKTTTTKEVTTTVTEVITTSTYTSTTPEVTTTSSISPNLTTTVSPNLTTTTTTTTIQPTLPQNYTTLCPTDYCIDYKWSNMTTCIFPEPSEIQTCFDNFCKANTTFNETQGTYCKDWMDPEGRVCFGTSTPCECPTEDKIQAIIVNSTTNSSDYPSGWEKADLCEYKSPTTTTTPFTTRVPTTSTVSPVTTTTPSYSIMTSTMVLVLVLISITM